MTLKSIVSAVVLIAVTAAGFLLASPARTSGGAGGDAIELPERISPPAPDVPQPRGLPASARDVVPIAITMTSALQGPDGQRGSTTQVSTRTADRVHVALDGSRREWLFEQNPVDEARACGYLVDHEARQILVYDDSALRNEHGIRGWADVWSMRFDPAALDGMKATGESTFVGGERFVRYVAPDPGQDGTVEVWWSGRLALASRLVVRHAGRVMSSTVTRIDRDVQAGVLEDPRRRFLGYAVVDPADAGDRH